VQQNIIINVDIQQEFDWTADGYFHQGSLWSGSRMYDWGDAETKNKVIKMESLNLTEYSTTKEALQFYSRGAILISLGVITSAFSYPFSVRIAKRVFRLKNFLNIHMVSINLYRLRFP
jgi:hypothetical protein